MVKSNGGTVDKDLPVVSSHARKGRAVWDRETTYYYSTLPKEIYRRLCYVQSTIRIIYLVCRLLVQKRTRWTQKSVISHSNWYTEVDALERPENYFKLANDFGVSEAAVKNFVVNNFQVSPKSSTLLSKDVFTLHPQNKLKQPDMDLLKHAHVGRVYSRNTIRCVPYTHNNCMIHFHCSPHLH